MKPYLFVVLSCGIFFVFACGDGFFSGKRAVSGTGTGSGSGVLPPVQNQPLGVLKCSESAQGSAPTQETHRFNHHLKQLLSTTRNPDHWPAHQIVKCSREGGGGGALFRGSVGFLNGKRFSHSDVFDQNLTVSTNSVISIHIIDVHESPIAEFQMRAVSNQQITSAQEIVLTFEDGKGRVTMAGGIDFNGNFSGIFSYDNFVKWDGLSSFSSGQLGYFTVPSCGFFHCQ